MKSALRAVIDTNIFIAAILKSKTCLAIFEAIKEEKFQLVTSEDMLNELVTSSARAQFDFSEKERKEMYDVVRETAELFVPAEEVTDCRDPKDNMVLECALSGKADFIVTRDRDLLSLRKFKHTRILTPHKFIKRVKSQKTLS